MQSLTIGWEYLTGYATATMPFDRNRAEWPPHPARVFMALAATWFETGEDRAEGDALRWLERLGDPQLHLPPLENVFERSLVEAAVPPNYDRAAQIQLWWKRKRKLHFAARRLDGCIGRKPTMRTFPRVYVGKNPCFMHWPEAKGADEHRKVLDRLCGKVTRIGHSSSLVRMWVADNNEYENANCIRWESNDLLASEYVRVVSAGLLDMLTQNFGQGPRRRHAELSEQIKTLDEQKKTVKGKGSKQLKDEIIDLRIANATCHGQVAAENRAESGIVGYFHNTKSNKRQIQSLETKLKDLVPLPPVRPSIGLWSGYHRVESSEVSAVQVTQFDTDMLILAQVAGPRLPVTSALTVTRALRCAVMSQSGTQPVPAWVSGHQPGGSRCEDDAGHMAYVPLLFVGYAHADGHLMGVALVFPRSVDRRERGRVLGKLLLEVTGQPREIELALGRLGVWTVVKRDWSETRRALQPETWTAFPAGTTRWASVTPVVLDKFPKADRVKNRSAWTDEVAGIIADACRRIGLPRPEQIDIDTTSWHLGCPRAVGKRRPFRGQSDTDKKDTALGDGFPFYPPKGTSASRPQVHVWLRFAEPVFGPVLLGAGRYQGYGLCKPWKEGRQ